MRRTFLAAAFLAVGAAVAADPTPLPGPAADITVNGYKRLVNHPAVVADLKLDAKQAKAASEFGLEMSKKYNAAAAGLTGVAAKDRVKKKAEIREAIETEYRAGLAKFLTPAQLRRLGQVRVQAEGLAALAWPEVVAALNLTDAQKKQVEKLTKDADAARSAIVRTELPTVGSDADKSRAMTAKISAVYRKATDDAVGLLDATQKKTWKDLTGEPFDVTKIELGAGGKN